MAATSLGKVPATSRLPTERDLQAQQTLITGLIADEQSRWATFNAMLDELSKPVDVKTPR